MSLGSPQLDAALDRYLTSPPDDESQCHCYECGDCLYEDDEYYRLDDEIYCPRCAEEWLEAHLSTVTHDMASGE